MKEYVCPETKEGGYEKDYCDSCGCGEGCSKKKECLAYNGEALKND